MRKPLSDGFSRQIVAVSFDSDGKRIESDFDTMPEDEKRKIRIRNNQRALNAAGYVKINDKVEKQAALE